MSAATAVLIMATVSEIRSFRICRPPPSPGPPASSPSNGSVKVDIEVNRALREPDVVATLALQGTTAAGGTLEAFKTLIASEIRNWKDVAQKAGIKSVD